MLWALDPGADHGRREQLTLGEHGAASSAGVSRICLYPIVGRRACHTQEDTIKQAVRRGLWWGAAEPGSRGGVGTNDQATLHGEEQTRAAENHRCPLGWDTNFTWLQTRSGMLDKRPALEYLVGIDRYTGPPGATECLKTGRPDQRHPRVEPEMNRQRLRPIVPIQGSGGGQERQEKCACRG
jgi:hypothetical protein